MNYTLFNKRWFIKHQKILLFLLNTPLIRGWFRKKIGVLTDQEIDVIHPNAFFKVLYKENKDEVRATFYSFNKFSKRICYEFAPLWKAIHTWDMFINWLEWLRYEPIKALNYGFDTLNDLKSNEDLDTAPTDASIERDGGSATWAGIHGDTDGSSIIDDFYNTADGHPGIYCDGANPYDWVIRRVYLGFDTSPLGAGAVVSDASLYVNSGDGWSNSLEYDGEAYPDEDSGMYVCGYSGDDPGGTEDYDQFGTTSFAFKNGPTDLGGFNDTVEIELNSDGRDYISVDDITDFGLRVSADFEDNEPDSGFRDRESSYMGDASAEDKEPYLNITYTVSAGTAIRRLLMGVGI